MIAPAWLTVLLIAGSADAAWRAYPASAPAACASSPIVVSQDAWHYTCYEDSGGRGVILRDGVVLASLPQGALDAELFARTATLSHDGRVLAHALRVLDANGQPIGLAAAVNGTPIGRVYKNILWIELDASGQALAYAAEDRDNRFHVVTTSGEGPAISGVPHLSGMGPEGRVAYHVIPAIGEPRLFFNHIERTVPDMYMVAVSRDLKKSIIVTTSSERPGLLVDTGAPEPQGPWRGVTKLAHSIDGRYAYEARSTSNQTDTVVLDGNKFSCAVPSLYGAHVRFAPNGTALWTCRRDKGGYRLHVDGRPSIPFPETRMLMAALTPTGQAGLIYWADDGDVAVTPSGAIRGLPHHLADKSLAFDSEEEFHYYSRLDGQIALICAAAGEKRPRTCDRKAAALYRSAR